MIAVGKVSEEKGKNKNKNQPGDRKHTKMKPGQSLCAPLSNCTLELNIRAEKEEAAGVV